jgi:hypothetical protein
MVLWFPLENISEDHRILIWSILEAVRSWRGGMQITKWQRMKEEIKRIEENESLS